MANEANNIRVQFDSKQLAETRWEDAPQMTLNTHAPSRVTTLAIGEPSASSLHFHAVKTPSEIWIDQTNALINHNHVY